MATILIIDEEKISVSGIKFALETNLSAAEIFVARTCSQGLEYLETKKIDLVILDMMLPKGNMNFLNERIDFRYGIDLLIDIRSKQITLPVICYTIINNDPDLENQIKANEGVYICKLFENATMDLITTIKAKLKLQ